MATERLTNGYIRTTLGTVDSSTPGVWTERSAQVDYHPMTGTMTRQWVRERTWNEGSSSVGRGGAGAVGQAFHWLLRWVWTTILYLGVLLGFGLVCAIGGVIAHLAGANPLVGIAVGATLIAAVVAAEDA
jgi:hypothetical protein